MDRTRPRPAVRKTHLGGHPAGRVGSALLGLTLCLTLVLSTAVVPVRAETEVTGEPAQVSDTSTSAPQMVKKVYDADYNGKDSDRTWNLGGGRKIVYDEHYNDVTDAGIEDEIPFEIYAALPDNIESYNHYYMRVQDMMDDSLEVVGFDNVNIDVYLDIDGESWYEISIDADDENFSVEMIDTTNPSAAAVTVPTNKYKIYASDDQNFAIIFNDVKDIEGISGNKAFKISYKAKFNDKAVTGNSGKINDTEGNRNKASLVYSNDPQNPGDGTSEPKKTGTTQEDGNVVFTYELDVTKTGSVKDKEDQPLGGTIFALYKMVDGKKVYLQSQKGSGGKNIPVSGGWDHSKGSVDQSEAKEVYYDENSIAYWIYENICEPLLDPDLDEVSRRNYIVYFNWYASYVGYSGDAMTAENINACIEEFKKDIPSKSSDYVLTTDSSGQIKIYGIDSGTYYLEELEAPEGYKKIADPIQVTIEPTKVNTQNFINSTDSNAELKNGTENVLTDLKTDALAKTGSDGTYQKDDSVVTGDPGNQAESGIVTITVTNHANTFTLKYNANGGENAPADQTTESTDTNTSFTVSDKVPTRSGYRFLGWADEKDGTTATHQAGDIVNVSTTGGSTDAVKILYAVWQQDKYTVTYTDGVEGEEIFADRTTPDLHYGDETPAFNGTPARTGYFFAGWTPEVSATVTDTATYTATWKEDKNNNGKPDDQETKYTVTYTDGVEGTEIFADQVTENILSGTPTPEFQGSIPMRPGYIFAGWKPQVADTVTADATYTARWLRVSPYVPPTEAYTVIYNDGVEGETIFADDVHKGLSYGEKTPEYTGETPVREGYTFKGWTPEVADKVTQDVTYKAVWEKNAEPEPKPEPEVPDDLNGDDHDAYIAGYPDGTVKPGNNITRAETASIIFRLLKDDVRNDNLTYTHNYKDMKGSEWAETEVATLTKMHIVYGRSSDAFDPNAPITRAEFAAMFARFSDPDAKGGGTAEFSDIDGHWAEQDIKKAASLGWISGYPDGTFRPDSYITRAEAATLINHVLLRVPEEEGRLLADMIHWPDNADTSAWYYIAIQEATNSHDYTRENLTSPDEQWKALRALPDWNAMRIKK